MYTHDRFCDIDESHLLFSNKNKEQILFFLVYSLRIEESAKCFEDSTILDMKNSCQYEINFLFTKKSSILIL